ncbi:SDR family NAD(P)-dependent oxidoreductase, partial [Streptomyces sp. NPDC060030]|uniref:SDR family NAD(P)-dependent oxidoreductase n=1 Tax=Streptomyces sp. NPDC060030 TaxID=3347042 RepID=UPI0036B1DD76
MILSQRFAIGSRGSHVDSILITSSLSATLPTPYETVYGPSRAFTRMFALGLREELKEHGVSVTCLMPGATDIDADTRVPVVVALPLTDALLGCLRAVLSG